MKATILGLILMLFWILAKWQSIDIFTLFIGIAFGIALTRIVYKFLENKDNNYAILGQSKIIKMRSDPDALGFANRVDK